MNDVDVSVGTEDPFPFTIIPNELDDAALDPYTYRVYGRLARRAGGVPGKGGKCFESMQKMADACQMSRRKFMECITNLIKNNMVQRFDHENSTCHFVLTNPKRWLTTPPQKLHPPLAPGATPLAQHANPLAPDDTKTQIPSTLGFKSNLKNKPIKSTTAIAAPAEPRSAGSLVWDAYSIAWKDRYGVDPVRNAKTNSLCKQLVDRLGDEARAVAAFYVQNDSDKFWTKQAHPLSLLLSNAERIGAEFRGFQIIAAERNNQQIPETIPRPIETSTEVNIRKEEYEKQKESDRIRRAKQVIERQKAQKEAALAANREFAAQQEVKEVMRKQGPVAARQRAAELGLQ